MSHADSHAAPAPVTASVHPPGGQAHSAHHAEGHAGHHHVNYMAVFIALCVCTALSIMFDVFRFERLKVLTLFLVMSVAVAKAMFVMTYFMHLKFEGAWKFVILAPTAILAVGLMVALAPDIGVHYYTVDVPQTQEHAARGSWHAGSGDAHGKEPGADHHGADSAGH